MSLLNDLKEVSDANRMIDLENRAKKINVQGDFQGSVTGTWVAIGPAGEGIVKYNDKTYKTDPLGFVSIPKGTKVELTHANGIYYSKY